MELALAITAPAALMFAGHWFPWRRVLGYTLPRPLAYAYGLGVILGVASYLIWYTRSDWQGALLFLWVVAASAGLATLTAYAIDEAVEARHLRADAKDKAEHDRPG